MNGSLNKDAAGTIACIVCVCNFFKVAVYGAAPFTCDSFVRQFAIYVDGGGATETARKANEQLKLRGKDQFTAEAVRIGRKGGLAGAGVAKTGKGAKGMPNTGGSAKGVANTGGSAKGVANTGGSAKGVANTGGRAKGCAKTGGRAKGVPNSKPRAQPTCQVKGCSNKALCPGRRKRSKCPKFNRTLQEPNCKPPATILKFFRPAPQN